jgi:phenylalanyl-tRNA synthetase beta chain
VNVSRRWLEAFLRRPLDAKEVAGKLAMLGAPADAIVALHQELSGIVVALVEEVRPHPNADRLRLCTVNDGQAERHHVVCGAPNVVVGGKYPFARIGASLPGGLVIEQRKIRGEPSEGMLCSPRELGLGADHDGLMTLTTDAAPGSRFLDVLALDDDRLELDTAPVRADLLGHKGVARELAAAFKTTFRLPDIEGSSADVPRPARTTGPADCGGVSVSIEPGCSCARFAAAVIRGVTVGPSPAWLRQRLEAIGQRSINNVVDATNYVMFELGQPLHAYDLGRLAGPSIAARLALPGERLVTLDGVDRALDTGMTVIADAAAAVGIAGVMGGHGSEISAATTDLLLECAWFAPVPTRATRKAVGLSTEASQRFERGTDLQAVPDALRRCIQVLLSTAGGRVDGESVDCWPEPSGPPRIFLRTSRVAQVLGVELPVHVLEQCFVAIGATLVNKPAEHRLAVEVPGWRPDLLEEIDLIEEVARIYGYDAFPDELRPFRAGNQTDAPIHVTADQVRRGLAAEGLLEAVLLPLGPSTGAAEVPVLNPLSAEHGFLRARLTPGLVRQVEANWANQVRDVRLFEVGTVFAPGLPGDRPMEETRVAAVITGARVPPHWSDGGSRPECDAWDLKGLFERTVSLAIPGASVQVEGNGWVAMNAAGRAVGRAGPLVADAPPWAAPLFGLEVEVDAAPRAVRRFRPLPTTPAATRDLALLLPDGAPIESVVGAVSESAGGLLERVAVTDEYRGPELPAGRRSVTLHLVLRGRERTLRDVDVEAVVQRILSKLGQSLDVTLRTN